MFGCFEEDAAIDGAVVGLVEMERELTEKREEFRRTLLPDAELRLEVFWGACRLCV